MKKVKQVLAILLILILIGLYVSTLVFAIIGSERAMVWLKISIYATIVLPVLLWAYGGVNMIVIFRSRSEESVLVAITAGTVHPNPISIGTKLLPESPIFRNSLSITNAILAI